MRGPDPTMYGAPYHPVAVTAHPYPVEADLASSERYFNDQKNFEEYEVGSPATNSLGRASLYKNGRHYMGFNELVAGIAFFHDLEHIFMEDGLTVHILHDGVVIRQVKNSLAIGQIALIKHKTGEFDLFGIHHHKLYSLKMTSYNLTRWEWVECDFNHSKVVGVQSSSNQRVLVVISIENQEKVIRFYKENDGIFKPDGDEIRVELSDFVKIGYDEEGLLYIDRNNHGIINFHKGDRFQPVKGVKLGSALTRDFKIVFAKENESISIQGDNEYVIRNMV